MTLHGPAHIHQSLTRQAFSSLAERVSSLITVTLAEAPSIFMGLDIGSLQENSAPDIVARERDGMLESRVDVGAW